MIKLPDEWKLSDAEEFICMLTPPSFEEASLFAWNACLAEVHRLNATAQPVSDGRTMREHEFAQMVNELRDVPAIQSKRAKIVGILKAFNIRPAAPGGQDG